MPISDNLPDRLKEALVPTSAGAAAGQPGIITADPSGWSVSSRSAIDTALTITQNPDANERALICGFGVGIGPLGTKNDVTVSLLGSGAAILWQTHLASGSQTPYDRDFTRPINAGLAATCQLYVGPAGASIQLNVQFYGYSAGGI